MKLQSLVLTTLLGTSLAVAADSSSPSAPKLPARQFRGGGGGRFGGGGGFRGGRQGTSPVSRAQPRSNQTD